MNQKSASFISNLSLYNFSSGYICSNTTVYFSDSLVLLFGVSVTTPHLFLGPMCDALSTRAGLGCLVRNTQALK